MRSTLTVLGLIALIALPAAVSARRWTTAMVEYETAQAQRSQTAMTINQINNLRFRQPQVESHEKPQQAIIAQVNAVLATIGIDQSALAGVTPLGDESYLRGNTAGASPYRAQSVQVRLRELSVRDATRFLQHWRQQHPIWQPMQIQLTHGRQGGENSNRFSLTLTLRSIYLAAGSPSTGN